MKITYTGIHIALAPTQVVELDAEFAKVKKLLDTATGEAQAHVVLKRENNSNHAEVTISWHNHELVGEAGHADLFTAVHAAVGKVQAQAVRLREKERDLKRVPVQ
jgi:ribosomal subunit interface protein